MAVLPKIQNFLDQIALTKSYLAAQGFIQNQSNTREALANITQTYLTDYIQSVRAIDDVIYNGHYPVPIRIYVPSLEQALPVACFIHGGGHMCGSITVYDKIARKLAHNCKQIVIAIDYRLAPEFSYPTPINDCKAVIHGLFGVLARRNIQYTTRDLTLIGDSAGGAICASLVMDKELVAVEQIKRQILIYPALDYTATSAALTKFAEGYFLEKAKILWYRDNYFQNAEDFKQVSPVYGEFYAKMPATLVITAAYDPLQGDGALYYNNVMQVGATAELIHIDGVIHAYLMLENLCPAECTKTYQALDKFIHQKLPETQLG